MSYRRVVAEAAFGLGPFDDLTTGVTWTSLGRVQSAEWTLGRMSEFEDHQAGEAVVVVRDDDRDFDPDNASGSHFGDLLPRVPVRLRSMGSVLDLPGATGANASTPDHTSFAVTDLDVRAHLAMDDWTPTATQVVASQSAFITDIGWSIGVTSGGLLTLTWSTAGTLGTAITVNSSTATGFADGSDHWVRATLDVDDGAGNRVVRFYTSTDGVTWTQLGTTSTTAGTTSIFNSTQPLLVGGSGTAMLAGQVRHLELLASIDGTPVANPDFTAFAPGTISFTDSVGRSWSVNGTAVIVEDTFEPDDEFYGYVAGGWEVQPTATTNNVKVELVDLLDALQVELPDVFDHAILTTGTAANQRGYWVFDEEHAESVADLTANNHDGRIVGAVQFGQSPIRAGQPTSALFEASTETFGSLDLGRSPIIDPGSSMFMVATFRVRNTADALNWRTLAIQGDGNAPQVGFQLDVGTTGLAHFVRRNSAGTTNAYQHPQNVADGDGHIVMAQTANGVAVDSVTYDTTAGSSSVGSTNGVGVGGAAGVQMVDHWDGWIGAVAIWQGFSPGTSTRQAILDGFSKLDGQRSDQQIGWALDRVGVPAAMRNFDEGSVLMGPADTKGRDALAWIRDVTRTEQGEFYVDHRDNGKLRFRHRYARHLDGRSTTVQTTFDDRNQITDTIPYAQDGLELAPNGLDSIVNIATVTWRDGEITHQDDTSVAAYGPRPRQIDTQATTAAQARSVAEWLVARRKDPASQVRGCISSNRQMLARNDHLQTLQVGDRVAFRIQPGNSGSVTTRDLWVEGLTHSCRGPVWEMSVRFAPADDFQPWVWGVSEWGVDTYWG